MASPAQVPTKPRAPGPVTEEARAQQALEDFIVQVEIFLQYSLQSKAVERLQRIAELFPGEEEQNERLRSLYERANWWPKGAPPKPASKPAPTASSRSDPSVPTAPAAPVTDNPSVRRPRKCNGRRHTPRSRGDCRNQSPDVPPIDAARSAHHHCVRNRQASRRYAMRRSRLAARVILNSPQITPPPGVQMAGPQRIAAIAELMTRVSPDSLGGSRAQPQRAPACCAIWVSLPPSA